MKFKSHKIKVVSERDNEFLAWCFGCPFLPAFHSVSGECVTLSSARLYPILVCPLLSEAASFSLCTFV